MTEAAIGDVLAQTVPTRLLIINQGVEDAFRERLERIAEEYADRVLMWSHVPSLPSLSATWNCGLHFAWETGATEALVINNDLRLHRRTVETLCTVRRLTKALFITAVGVGADQFHPDAATGDLYMGAGIEWDSTGMHVIDQESGITSVDHISKGGPDFSAFLISKEGHEKYPFDEAFIPAFAEDLDMHRRYMLGGDGERIFSINLPFHHLHGGSQTLKSLPPDQRQALESRINAGSRAHYRAKWGGDVNQERYTIPFEPASAQDGVTTPDLQHAMQT